MQRSIDPRTWSTVLTELACLSIVDIIEHNSLPQATIAVATCGKLLENVHRDRSKYGTLKSSSAALRERLLGAVGGEAALVALGFETTDTGFTWPMDRAADDEALATAAAAIRAAHGICEAVREAIVGVGDTNTPARAEGAIALLLLYVSNILGATDAEACRRIGAANRALTERVLGIAGGPTLLRACGFGPEPVSGPIAYVCGSDVTLSPLWSEY